MALEEFEAFTLAAEEIMVTDSSVLGASPLPRSEPTVLEEVAKFWDRGFLLLYGFYLQRAVELVL
jgi:hypothetical protein